jgi:hypothetical protein
VPWAWAMRQVPLPGLEWATAWDSLWPVVLGAVVFVVALKLKTPRIRLPEGDLVAWLEPLMARCLRVAEKFGKLWMDWEPKFPDLWPRQRKLNKAEAVLGRLAVAGMCLLIVILALWVALIL